eukprot:350413-Chlamydomonas_euryale.AAC.13
MAVAARERQARDRALAEKAAADKAARDADARTQRGAPNTLFPVPGLFFCACLPIKTGICCCRVSWTVLSVRACLSKPAPVAAV